MTLQNTDPLIYEIISKEYNRQRNKIELIASENFVSKSVLEAQGSILTNKYAEGYPYKRYYEGCEYVDQIEEEAISRAKKLFGCEYVNVQPHSGSQANQAVFLGLLNPGDTILAMSLNSGGHLTHGSSINLSGKWFNVVSYNVNRETYLLDYDEIEHLALKYKPKLIIAGFSAYSRAINFSRFKDIATRVGAFLMADIAHIAGLVATGYHQNPTYYADVVTSTTHKTLRGPRGGIILSNNPDLFKKLNSAVFPGLQGGPLMHIIAAKAVGFKENSEFLFKQYINQVIINAQILASILMERGYKILTNGTDNHIVMVDLRDKGITGKDASKILDHHGISCNKNAIPFDDTSPFITSGIRLGTPACTTRGFERPQITTLGNLIADILDNKITLEESKEIVQGLT